MIVYGILIGVALTVLTVVLAWALRKKNLTPLSYIVIVVALAAFCFEGVLFVQAYDDRKDASGTANIIADIATTTLLFTPEQVQEHRLGYAEASAIKTGLRWIYPSVAQHLEAEDLAGKTISECIEVFRKSIIRSADQRIWNTLIYMVLTLIITIALILLSTNAGGKSRKMESTTEESSDESYSPSNYDDF